MEKVYICHQYYAPSHYKALYECALNYGYQIMNLIVLSPLAAKKYRNELIEQEGANKANEWYQNNVANKKNLKQLKENIIIIGVFPYNSLLLQYEKVLSQNYSIYMTSWMDWHSGYVPFPFSDKKSAFIEILKHSIKGIACVSNRTEREMRSINNITQVVNHSVCISEYKKKNDFKRKGKYIFLGRFVECKNIESIIEYLKTNPEKNIEVDFAGEGQLEEVIKDYAIFDTRLHLIGYLSKDKIKMYLHEYDYLILPSYMELFGIVLLEALASGVPCIVSNALGPAEIISHKKTGVTFRLNDPKGFENAMDYSMEMDDKQYEIMSKNAVRESERYDVNEVVKKWVSLFEKVSRQ